MSPSIRSERPQSVSRRLGLDRRQVPAQVVLADRRERRRRGACGGWLVARAERCAS